MFNIGISVPANAFVDDCFSYRNCASRSDLWLLNPFEHTKMVHLSLPFIGKHLLHFQ